MRSIHLLTAAAVGAVAAISGQVGAAQSPSPYQFLEPVPTPIRTANLQLAPSQTSNLGTFNIVIVPGAGLSSNAPALAAFQRAAAAWSSRITDPITVTINADLATSDPLGNAFAPSTIGSTSSVSLQGGYDLIRNAMVSDSNAQAIAGPGNKAAVAALPSAAQFTATLPAGRTFGGNIVLTKANAKAAGFTTADSIINPSTGQPFGPVDGTIVFNSAFTFDYDNTNGVSAGQIDFQTAATHEIGHALGFSSIVDSVDAGATTVNPTTLDLFRFARTGANHPTSIAAFSTAPRDLTPGADDVTSDITNEHRMATGIMGGDGTQASHWKDDAQTGTFIGIMDPTLASGTTEPVTDADFRAMDLIGYDVVPVPEPASAGLLAAAGLLQARRRRGGIR